MAEKEQKVDRIQQLEELLAAQGAQIQEMSAALTQSKTLTPKRVAENTAKVMFINDKPVIQFGSERKVNGQSLIPVVLKNEAGEEEKDLVPYLEMLNNSPRYTCEILKQEAHEKKTHQGPIPVEWMTQPNDPVGLRESGKQYSPRRIVLDQTMVTYTARIRFVEGPWMDKELDIDTKCLNP